jgi:hypothetical protein
MSVPPVTSRGQAGTSNWTVDAPLYFFRENRRNFLVNAAAFFRSSATTVGNTRRRAASACVSSRWNMFEPVPG